MNKCLYALIVSLLLLACGEIRHESIQKMNPVNMSDIKIEDDFWTPYLLIHKDVTLPICIDRIEKNFDSVMVAKAAEGIAYSLQFEDDPELKVKRGNWTTRLKSGSYQDIPLPDNCEVNAAVSSFFNEAESLLASGNGVYADNMENVLYNKLLAGISLKGDRFSNEIPLSSKGDWNRVSWEEVPSSAVDLFRVIPSVGNYAYGTSKGTIWVNLYMGGTAKVEIAGEKITIDQTTSYPWDGYMSLRLGLQKPLEAEIRVRIPSWCDDYTITINGIAMNVPIESGYALLKRKWQNADNIELILNMPVEMTDTSFWGKNENGKRIVRRGPIVYCVEDIDNPFDYGTIHLSKYTKFTMKELPKEKWWGHSLTQIKARVSDEQTLSLIPYFAWGNRAPGKMDVFIPFASE